MTKIELKDVEAGDRVRLVNDNGDEATVTATQIWEGFEPNLESAYNLFSTNDGWHVAEILPKPVILPTGENAMVARRADTNAYPYVLMDGEWWSVAGANTVPVHPSLVRNQISCSGFEVVFEGVQGDE